jgi:hypothetical protein
VHRLEQALAVTEQEREDHQPQLIDEIGVQEGSRELPAAVYDEVALELALELACLCDRVSREDLSVPSRRRGSCAR